MLKKITFVVLFAVVGAVGYAGAASATTAQPAKAKTIGPAVPQLLCPFVCM